MGTLHGSYHPGTHTLGLHNRLTITKYMQNQILIKEFQNTRIMFQDRKRERDHYAESGDDDSGNEKEGWEEVPIKGRTRPVQKNVSGHGDLTQNVSQRRLLPRPASPSPNSLITKSSSVVEKCRCSLQIGGYLTASGTGLRYYCYFHFRGQGPIILYSSRWLLSNPGILLISYPRKVN
jgi:hypothetical protein